MWDLITSGLSDRIGAWICPEGVSHILGLLVSASSGERLELSGPLPKVLRAWEMLTGPPWGRCRRDCREASCLSFSFSTSSNWYDSWCSAIQSLVKTSLSRLLKCQSCVVHPWPPAWATSPAFPPSPRWITQASHTGRPPSHTGRPGNQVFS